MVADVEKTSNYLAWLHNRGYIKCKIIQLLSNNNQINKYRVRDIEFEYRECWVWYRYSGSNFTLYHPEENCPQVLVKDCASNLSSHIETFESSVNDSPNESTENEICLLKPERKALKKLENLDSSDDRKFLEKDSKRLPLKIGKLSCIEIHKGSKALGIKVVGGNDMSLVKCRDAPISELDRWPNS
ncbi:hypothetical protein HELRODRAFT_171451 [Helobdella robusta]|uniref:Uncharacterized protein n=1 Tax=Helobdella robusta TaxID=6412 RepID=T1F4A7_HELRO|nr:hypothetical protein HELRODRAFT_171451 [Helobdella robusta]ESO05779.1 hypothetical protein HELRODRAFT_171451 [Helobdella robusta]